MNLTLGFVAGTSQAPALIGIQKGLFAAALRGTGIRLHPVPFRTDATEAAALTAGQLDVAYASAESIFADLASPHSTRISIVSGAEVGKPATVNLVVTRTFLSAHSQTVLDVIKAQVQANDLINHDLLASAAACATELTTLTGRHVPASTVGTSLAEITFTDDPDAPWMTAHMPHSLEITARPELATLYDIALLNLLLRMNGERPVSA